MDAGPHFTVKLGRFCMFNREQCSEAWFLVLQDRRCDAGSGFTLISQSHEMTDSSFVIKEILELYKALHDFIS